jgi:TonB family protein
MRHILALSLLLPTLSFPAAAIASQPVDAAPTSTTVSTGVVAPTILNSTNLTISSDSAGSAIPSGAQVELSLTVDENGHPENIHVVKPLTPTLDASVVSAVRQFHFRPGSVSNQPVAVPMYLIVNVTR